MGRTGRILGWAGGCRSSKGAAKAHRSVSTSTATSTSHDCYYYKNMNRVIAVMTVLLLGSAIDCGAGVPILTRIPNGKGAYGVAMQCLCPIDYHGLQCKHHRRVQCYLQTQQTTPEQIDQGNFEQQLEIKASISADCYIQLDNQNFISFVEYFLRKEVQSQLFEYELQSGRQGGEIIWANDSSLLDADGFVIYQEGYNYSVDQNGTRRMSAKDEQTILNGKGKHEFQYKSDFLGFPFTDSHFAIIPHIYKAIGNSKTLPQQAVDFTNYNEYLKEIRQRVRKERQAKEYIQGLSWTDVLNELSGFSVDKVVKQVQEKAKEAQDMYRMQVVPLINCSILVDVREQAEFKMIKGQFKMVETYGAKSTHVVSINSAVMRVPVEVSGVGEATIYNNNFYKPPSRLLYFFLAFLALGVLYLVFRCYKSWRMGQLRQFKKQVEQQYEQRELG